MKGTCSSSHFTGRGTARETCNSGNLGCCCRRMTHGGDVAQVLFQSAHHGEDTQDPVTYGRNSPGSSSNWPPETRIDSGFCQDSWGAITACLGACSVAAALWLWQQGALESRRHLSGNLEQGLSQTGSLPQPLQSHKYTLFRAAPASKIKHRICLHCSVSFLNPLINNFKGNVLGSVCPFSKALIAAGITYF